uniref:Putative secreted protein n=1 Tax=Xenopsylla cheopis TaxID=163159 RepID=A0A6M2DIA9_XENCH
MANSLSYRHTDCKECKIASGAGLIGIAVYLKIQASKLGKNRLPIYVLAAGFAGAGCYRLSQLLNKTPD